MACGFAPYRLATVTGLREVTKDLLKRPRDFSRAAEFVIVVATGQA